MKTIDFGLNRSKRITHFGSSFSIARLLHNEDIHIGCMYFRPGARVGYHRAQTYQIFAVVQGHGWVRTGEGERMHIESGEAVMWEPGEEHEAGTEHSMMAMVIEGDVLKADPGQIGPVQGATPARP